MGSKMKAFLPMVVEMLPCIIGAHVQN
jgi:hypothetical protein